MNCCIMISELCFGLGINFYFFFDLVPYLVYSYGVRMDEKMWKCDYFYILDS